MQFRFLDMSMKPDEAIYLHKFVAPGDTVLHTAIDVFDIAAVKHLLSKNEDANVVNRKRQTPLVHALLQLQYYRRAFIIPSRAVLVNCAELCDIVHMLVPHTNVMGVSSGLPHTECPLGLCLRSDIMNVHTSDMSCTIVMLRHGAMLPFATMLSIAISQREILLRFIHNAECNFFTDRFVSFVRLTGVPFENVIEFLENMPSCILHRYTHFVTAVKCILSYPLPLQALCVITIRRSLYRTGDKLWSNIDLLPLPHLLITSLKIVSRDY